MIFIHVAKNNLKENSWEATVQINGDTVFNSFLDSEEEARKEIHGFLLSLASELNRIFD